MCSLGILFFTFFSEMHKSAFIMLHKHTFCVNKGGGGGGGEKEAILITCENISLFCVITIFNVNIVFEKCG